MIRYLLPLLVLFSACTRPPGQTPSAPPAAAPSTDTSHAPEQGHSGGNGGDLLDPAADAAWFVGNRQAIQVCLEVAPDFGWDEGALKTLVKRGWQTWTRYIEEKKVYFAAGDKYVHLEFPSQIEWSTHCSPTEGLRLLFGTSDERVRADLQRGPTRLAFAMPTFYDAKKRWGAGYVWFASPKSVGELPDWKYPEALYAMVLHELGHVLGCSHVTGTIMDAKIADRLRSLVEHHTDPADVPAFVLTQIDQQRELYFCRFCDATYRGNLPWYGQFEKLTGRDRHDYRKAFATVRFLHHEGVMSAEWILSDEVGDVNIPLHIEERSSRRSPSPIPVFKVVADVPQRKGLQVFAANGGDGWTYWGEATSFDGKKFPVLLQINTGFDETQWSPTEFDFYQWTMPLQIQGPPQDYASKALFEGFRVPSLAAPEGKP